MKKLFILFFLCKSLICYAQISTYSKYDNVKSTVYEIEDLSSDEIKIYNSWIKNGLDGETALVLLNAGRAQSNLIAAPATIIDIHYCDEITEDDSIPEAIGAANVMIQLINTTPKTIRTITFEFEFANEGTPVYDIKTGDKYCVLTFENLSGRTKSDKYDEIFDNLLKCYHILKIEKASKKKLFFNRKANTIKLHSVSIQYTDGTSSNKVAIFDHGFLRKDKITANGPLSPFLNILLNDSNY